MLPRSPASTAFLRKFHSGSNKLMDINHGTLRDDGDVLCLYCPCSPSQQGAFINLN